MLDFKEISTPWTVSYGVARSLISGALGLTLLLTPAEVLFTTPEGVEALQCEGYKSYLYFCLTENFIELEFSTFLLGIFLLLIATGITPFLTAIPLFYFSFSVYGLITIPDGGDQIAQILTSLLIPISIFDIRFTTWKSPESNFLGNSKYKSIFEYISKVFFYLLKIQISIIYFWAGVSKISQPAWREGTAIYYWINDPTFGTSDPLGLLIRPLVENPLISLTITWGTIFLEVMLGMSLFLSKEIKIYLLGFGVVFHVLIFILLGISSFGVIMIGALILLLTPVSQEIVVRKQVK